MISTRLMLVAGTLMLTLSALPVVMAGSEGGGDDEGEGRWMACERLDGRRLCVIVLEDRCTVGVTVAGVGGCPFKSSNAATA